MMRGFYFGVGVALGIFVVALLLFIAHNLLMAEPKPRSPPFPQRPRLEDFHDLTDDDDNVMGFPRLSAAQQYQRALEEYEAECRAAGREP